MNNNVIKAFLCGSIFASILVTTQLYADNIVSKVKSMGIFARSDQQLEGIKYGNWGSRPYEYYWIANSVDISNKKVIDLGVGLPSQYEWYKYVVNTLRPEYYVGVDTDGRMKSEIIKELNHAMLHMDMTLLAFPDKEFDIAYCISTFEHIPYLDFMKAIQEAHRVLKDDGYLVLTLDEFWDKNIPLDEHNGWNILEQTVPSEKRMQGDQISFGLPDFLELIKEYFVPVDENVVIDINTKKISSSKDGAVYYQRQNRDPNILYSPEVYNSCVSYAVLKKR